METKQTNQEECQECMQMVQPNAKCEKHSKTAGKTANMTKPELIAELNAIVQKLIKQGKLVGYPFNRSINGFNVQLLRDGIILYGDKLEAEN